MTQTQTPPSRTGRKALTCKGGCGRRTERREGWCLKCAKGMAPQAIHALTGGRWVRRGLTWRWE